MTNLDDISTYKSLDKSGMLDGIKGFPEQCRNAWQTVKQFSVPDDYRNIDKVLVLGMGGSAIGGDLVRSLVEGESRVPVMVHRDYALPAYADDNTLMLFSSYSGNTEETLSGFAAALKLDSKKLALTTGCKLAEKAKEAGVPVFHIDYKGQPRAALGWSFIPTLGVLQKLGLIQDKENDVVEAMEVLKTMVEELNESVPEAKNLAKQMARRFYSRLPVVYGTGITSEVAHRWKTQVNENSKAWAFYEVLPEMNHNATVGFPYPPELAKQMQVVFLRSSLMNERVKLRYEITGELLNRADVPHEYLDSRGRGALAQMLGLISFGDFVSYYLAILYGIDPSPVEVIDYLKRRLAKG